MVQVESLGSLLLPILKSKSAAVMGPVCACDIHHDPIDAAAITGVVGKGRLLAGQ